MAEACCPTEIKLMKTKNPLDRQNSKHKVAKGDKNILLKKSFGTHLEYKSIPQKSFVM